MSFDPVAARAALPVLDWRAPAAPAGELLAYVRHYRLDTLADPGVRHGMGRIEAAGYRIAVQCWRHDDGARGTVLVLHGYYDHIGIFDHVIAHLLTLGFDVVAFDLPGHGLSSGAPAVIDDFATYQSVLHSVLAGLRESGLPSPRHVVAQSTGGAILMEYLLSQHRDGTGAGNLPFYRAVLLAPLVRPVNWRTNRLLYHAMRPFRDAIPRKFAVNSHDAEFLRFLRDEDPLQARELSTRWVGAMKRWIPRMEAHATSDFPLTIVQGDEDGTVDWRHNLGVIRQKFPRADIHLIPGGRHQLANEAPPWRAQVLAVITQTLS